MNVNVLLAEEAMKELMRMLPVVRMVGGLEQWSYLYMEAFLIKLMCMK